MRAHLLRIIDTDLDTDTDTLAAQMAVSDISAAANDMIYNVSLVESPKTSMLPPGQTLGLLPVERNASDEDDAYWLGGYAGI
jgi:hypothetical protein